MVMWPNFGTSRVSTREIFLTSIVQAFDQKKQIFWGVLLVQV